MTVVCLQSPHMFTIFSPLFIFSWWPCHIFLNRKREKRKGKGKKSFHKLSPPQLPTTCSGVYVLALLSYYCERTDPSKCFVSLLYQFSPLLSLSYAWKYAFIFPILKIIFLDSTFPSNYCLVSLKLHNKTWKSCLCSVAVSLPILFCTQASQISAPKIPLKPLLII